MFINPFIYTPISDFTFILAPPFKQKLGDLACAKIESRYMDCLEAYGTLKARDKCAELMYDLCECRNFNTQKKRAEAMKKERMRLYREGKLKRPFEEYPPMDAHFY